MHYQDSTRRDRWPIMSATDTPVIDAEIVEDAAPVSTEVVRRERRSEVIRPLDAEQLVEGFELYQELLPRLLTASDYQDAGHGERFVKKSGWRKIATAFDLDVVRVVETVDRDESGKPLRAMAVYRAIAPSGRSMDGDGYCSIEEGRFSRASGRGKLEHDLRATAATRARNRAISDLVGMGEVSAEEVDANAISNGAPAVQAASPKATQNAQKAIALILAPHIDDEDERQVRALLVLGEIERNAGCDLSSHHANAVVLAAKALHSVATASAGLAASADAPTGPQEDAAPPAASSAPPCEPVDVDGVEF
jgi:hypothetical protein